MSAKARGGYSLIEVMLVVSVLGVIAALAVPKVTDMIDTRNAANEVLKFRKTLEKARDDARETRRCVHITQTSTSQLTLDVRTLVAATGACDVAIESTSTADFNANLLSITAGLDILFDKNGGVSGTAADFTDVTATTTASGISRTRTFRIFTLLGLIRPL